MWVKALDGKALNLSAAVYLTVVAAGGQFYIGAMYAYGGSNLNVLTVDTPPFATSAEASAAALRLVRARDAGALV